MRRLFDAAGVDFTQWRALMRAYTLTDYAALRGAYGPREQRRAVLAWALMCAFFLTMGAAPAATIILSPDTLLAATAMTTTTMWLVGVILLSQASSILLPDDYAIVGFRPVSSRTYLAVRLGALLSQAVEAAVLSGAPSVFAFAVRSGGSWRQALAAAFAILASALTMTFGLVAVCGWLQGFVRPARLQRALLYAQTILLLVLSGVYMTVWLLFVDGGAAALASVASLELPRHVALLSPGGWFGAYVEMAGGRGGAREIAAAIFSLVVLAALAASLRGRLSADYAIRVAHMAVETPADPAAAPRQASFLRNERRAMVVLMLGQLRGDMTVQSAALMMLVTSGGMVAVFARMDGWPGDPFLGGRGGMTQLALLMIPLTIRDILMKSTEYEASWPLLASPADRASMIAAARDTIALCLLLPLVAIFGGLFLYSFNHAGHALVHTAFSGLNAYIVLQMSVMMDPGLPFSRPMTKGSSFLVGILPVVVGGSLLALVIQKVFYSSPTTTIAGLVAMGVLIVVLNRLTARRAGRATP